MRKFNLGEIVASVMAAIAHLRAEKRDDGILTPWELLDVIVCLVESLYAFLPGWLQAALGAALLPAKGIILMFGETPGPDPGSEITEPAAAPIDKPAEKKAAPKPAAKKPAERKPGTGTRSRRTKAGSGTTSRRK